MSSLFTQHSFKVNPQLCFVIMPFEPTLKNVYDAVEAVIEDYCGLTCLRGDELSNPERITNDIWTSINEARFLIADLTNRNPNVFYELGMAHTLGKPVILMAQGENDVPFDLREVRYLQYDRNNLAELKRSLPKYVKSCISTIPANWNQTFSPPDWMGPYIKIIDLDVPPTVALGQPFEITLTARNNSGDFQAYSGLRGMASNILHETMVVHAGTPDAQDLDKEDAVQGYFSISFPQGIDHLKIIKSNTETKIGFKGDFWGGESYLLKYPIAEGFKYGGACWRSRRTYFITVQGYARRKGLMRFYVNASCLGKDSNELMWDPYSPSSDIDQRGEYVYSGVIEVD